MNSDTPGLRSLRDIEMEVLAEGREWTRQRLEQKLQQEATRRGGVFPPKGWCINKYRRASVNHTNTATSVAP
jgi:hypothetical protein